VTMKKIESKTQLQNRLELVRGDITEEETEAIGNAANSRLAGGGGVDGAIHRKGGSALRKELNERYSGCPTGSAVITGGGHLKAKYVIHAVGPVYSGRKKDSELLASAYQSSLELCTEHAIRSISFPSISTGVYGYPLREAAVVALRTIKHYLRNHEEIQLVRFVLFDDRTFAAYQEANTN
jgi:O-acetyl-ADP-ribose deacetylase